ncbi:hypothetical protein R70723_02885 [Paenibacillus sp. FSL R7-0273]|uniref:glycosyltransferase family 39 protein n=1 Tax=Paenibacillus sp. FSL R7-0273 TaxID=1536772 RepID=UPI0004F8B9AC|nr:glycosyltransferase family 39 protein [Paenibacillus sp. FSL R7-0273]AIQ44966.1 hypothetical protein R70723_02885 [Paenibacillus sp. FSL R7-0273]OMF85816.1 hypothetical protein BK144_27165 [Paenibacillus sp. FSL R7-0273]
MSGILSRIYNSCKNNPWPLLLFVLGAIVRIVYIGSVPPGLNQDEASIGYDAYAILHYGIDRNGVHLPVHLIAWGSGQNALYAYLSMPFILLFGLTPLSVRALSVFMGLAGMIFFYLIMKRLFPSRTAGIAAMFFIAVNPWHIMMSRWALESNLFPTLILIAFYCLLRSVQSADSRWTYAFTAVLALSLYAYGTAYFFVPVFAAGSAILLLYCKAIKVRTLLWNALLFVLLSLPILLFIIINHYNALQAVTTPLFTVPKLTMPRVEEISSVFGGQLFKTAAGNFHEFLSILWSGSDGLPWNSISWYGYAYPLALPFALLGLIVMIRAIRKHPRKEAGRGVLLIWLLSAVLMAFITTVNINRINIVFYPLIMLAAAGFIWLYSRIKPAGILAAAVFAVMFGSFATVYFRDYPGQIGPSFHESAGEAIRYASRNTGWNIFVTDDINMPYIYVLFYERINPHDFQDTVVYSNPGGAFQQVTEFGRYSFGKPAVLEANSAYVISNYSGLPAAFNGEYTLKEFAHYTVLITGDYEGGASSPGLPDSSGLLNGGFEEGAAGWVFSAGTGVAGNNPYSGSLLAYLDAGADKTVAQSFTVQPEPGEYTLAVMASAGGSGGRISLLVNGNLQAEAEVTAGDAYHEIRLPAVNLSQGDLAEVIITGGNGWINIDEVRLER